MNLAAADTLMKIFGFKRQEKNMKSITTYKDGETILFFAFRYALGRKTYQWVSWLMRF